MISLVMNESDDEAVKADARYYGVSSGVSCLWS